jgi:hypothetical protein
MSTIDALMTSQMDEPKPHLVQRLLLRYKPDPKVDSSLFRVFQPDWMGAAEFEHGILQEALVQACQRCVKERWFVRPIHVSPDITVHYVGPVHRFSSACDFLQTQLIEDGSDRYMADRPLKEQTYLRQAYLCQHDSYQRYVGWWRLDLGHQFFLFKKESYAEVCLAMLRSSDWKSFKHANPSG